MDRTIEVFFENQRRVIIDNLSSAKETILIAMEFFTDHTLFNLLLKKAEEGVRVDLILCDDDINVMTGIDYQGLKGFKGDFCYKKNLHNRFCLIDTSILMTGLCNWTYDGIKQNLDLVVIANDIQICLLYERIFKSIKDPELYKQIGYARSFDRGKGRVARLERLKLRREISLEEKSSLSVKIYSELLYSDSQNSIASTVQSIIKPLSEYGFTGTKELTEAVSAFSILLGQRAQAAMFAGQTKGNLLLDTGMHVINGMYEECFVVDTDKYKLDLPLLVSVAMFLESSIKREDLKLADNQFKAEYFECIYKTCMQSLPEQIQFAADEAIEVLSKFNKFLLSRYS